MKLYNIIKTHNIIGDKKILQCNGSDIALTATEAHRALKIYLLNPLMDIYTFSISPVKSNVKSFKDCL